MINLKGFMKLPLMRICAGIVLIFAMLAGFEYVYSLCRVPLGLYLGETYIGGKGYAEVESYFKDYEDITVVVSCLEQDLLNKYSLDQLGIQLDREKTLQEIKSAGKPFLLRHKLALLFASGHILPQYSINEAVLGSVLHDLEKQVRVEARNAEVRAEGGALVFKPHRHGTSLQKEGIAAALLEKLSKNRASSLELPLTLICREADISVSTILDDGIKDILYTATTVFNPAEKNRVHNIMLAAEQVNNFRLKPGEQFSFNALVGDANSERGYKEAPIIVNDKLVMGAGGGICQVSSTVYNAALMTGMSITERYNHGLAVAYMPPGLDATVAYDYLDLKFRNVLSTHVLLHTQVEGDKLHVTFFGDPHALGKIEIRRKNLVKIPAPQHFQVLEGRPSWYREIIQEGKPGYTVETVRIFYNNGSEIKRESMGKDHYMPLPHIYAVGNMAEDRESEVSSQNAE